MTYRERRLVTFLSSILGLLVIALLIVLAIRYRENRAQTDPSSSAAVSAASGGAICTELTYFTDDASLRFCRDEQGRWIWAHDESFPLADDVITAILDTLSTLSPQQTMTAPESFDTYGLSQPWAGLTAVMSDGTTVTLSFGNATTDGASYYALRDGDTSRMYIYADTLVGLMSTPVYDMCALPRFPDLTVDRLQRITIQGASAPEGTERLRITMDASHDADGSTTWSCDGKDVTAASRLKPLLDDLAVLEAEKCADYHPSAKALSLCGFDDPLATLWCNYTTATDLTGHFQMTVGALTLDGQARYVRFNGDGFEDGNIIYRVSTDLLDPLMVIALSGLEG